MIPSWECGRSQGMLQLSRGVASYSLWLQKAPTPYQRAFCIFTIKPNICLRCILDTGRPQGPLLHSMVETCSRKPSSPTLSSYQKPVLLTFITARFCASDPCSRTSVHIGGCLDSIRRRLFRPYFWDCPYGSVTRGIQSSCNP